MNPYNDPSSVLMSILVVLFISCVFVGAIVVAFNLGR
jgi:hypothetical protein